MGITILQKWAGNPASFPLADEADLVLGTEVVGAVDPGAISLEQMRNGYRQCSMTIASIANGTNYATAESSAAGVGEHGISWDTDGWVTSIGGWWLVCVRLVYNVPAADGFEYWWPVPFQIPQKLVLRRYHKLAIEKNAAKVAATYKDHDNLVDNSNEEFEMNLAWSVNIDTNDKIRIYHDGSQSSGTIASWSVSAAQLSFVRLNQEDVV